MTKRTTKTIMASRISDHPACRSEFFCQSERRLPRRGFHRCLETMALAAYETPINNGGCGNNIWTLKNGASGVDGRSGSIPLETGNVWIVWIIPMRPPWCAHTLPWTP